WSGACGCMGRSAVEGDEGVIGGAAQEAVELLQLAALSLPAEPALLRLAPDTPTVQKQKTRRVGTRVEVVEVGDKAGRVAEHGFVAGRGLGLRVNPVRQDG